MGLFKKKSTNKRIIEVKMTRNKAESLIKYAKQRIRELEAFISVMQKHLE